MQIRMMNTGALEVKNSFKVFDLVFMFLELVNRINKQVIAMQNPKEAMYNNRSAISMPINKKIFETGERVIR